MAAKKLLNSQVDFFLNWGRGLWVGAIVTDVPKGMLKVYLKTRIFLSASQIKNRSVKNQ